MSRDLLAAVPDEDAAAREAALAEAERRDAAQASEDFDAFWSAQDRKATSLRNVFGVDVTLPAALPLRFEVEARAAATSTDPEQTKRMVGILFGDDALERWTSAGMDLEQFAVLLLWGTVNTRAPGSLTLAQAREAYAERAANPAGKALPQVVAGISGGASNGTGPRSKPTSRASTSSRKRK